MHSNTFFSYNSSSYLVSLINTRRMSITSTNVVTFLFRAFFCDPFCSINRPFRPLEPVSKRSQVFHSMGRSRASADDGSGQRSRRTRVASSKKNIDSSAAGQSSNESERAPRRCIHCKKDISGKIRIKCAQCPDVDLCVECFSVGAEFAHHRSDHPYRVMDSLPFPLICPDWTADEEFLLLEAIEMYGENWEQTAKHVGTKSSAQCIDHYISAYLNSPHFPLPDMSYTAGKNRDELLDMAKGQNECKKDSYRGCTPIGTAGADKKASDLASVVDDPDSFEVEDSRDRERNTSRSSGDEEPSLVEISGYNINRQEFYPGYDETAEESTAELKFKETDTKVDRELKLRMLHMYNRRLDERERREKFVLERDLLHPDPLLKGLSAEEKEIYHRYNVFMRFHSKGEHEELIKSAIEEHRIRKRIQELEEAQRAGCRTSAEADLYNEQKRRKEAQARAHKADKSAQDGPGRETTEGLVSTSSTDDWNITGLPGSDLLSENEKQLCCETRMLPSKYLRMQQAMTMLIFNGTLNKKSDAYSFFTIDPSILDRVYDILVRKQVAERG